MRYTRLCSHFGFGNARPFFKVFRFPVCRLICNFSQNRQVVSFAASTISHDTGTLSSKVTSFSSSGNHSDNFTFKNYINILNSYIRENATEDAYAFYVKLKREGILHIPNKSRRNDRLGEGMNTDIATFYTTLVQFFLDTFSLENYKKVLNDLALLSLHSGKELAVPLTKLLQSSVVTLIHKLTERRDTIPLGAILRDLENIPDLELNNDVYLAAVSAFAQAGRTRKMELSLSKLESRGYELTVDDLASVITGYGHAMEIEKVHSLEQQLLGRSDLTVGVFNALVLAYGNANQKEKMHEIVKTMDESGITPNEATFTTLISFCEDEESISSLLLDMQARNLELDVSIYNNILSVYARTRNWDMFDETLQLVASQDITKNTNTYDIISMALYDRNSYEATRLLITAMKEEGVPMSCQTLSTLLEMSCDVSDLNQVKQLLRIMMTGAIVPTRRCINHVIYLLIRVSEVELLQYTLVFIAKHNTFPAAHVLLDVWNYFRTCKIYGPVADVIKILNMNTELEMFSEGKEKPRVPKLLKRLKSLLIYEADKPSTIKEVTNCFAELRKTCQLPVSQQQVMHRSIMAIRQVMFQPHVKQQPQARYTHIRYKLLRELLHFFVSTKQVVSAAKVLLLYTPACGYVPEQPEFEAVITLLLQHPNVNVGVPTTEKDKQQHQHDTPYTNETRDQVDLHAAFHVYTKLKHTGQAPSVALMDLLLNAFDDPLLSSYRNVSTHIHTCTRTLTRTNTHALTYTYT